LGHSVIMNAHILLERYAHRVKCRVAWYLSGGINLDAWHKRKIESGMLPGINATAHIKICTWYVYIMTVVEQKSSQNGNREKMEITYSRQRYEHSKITAD